MRVRRVYLIRHGQTAWNALERWQGSEDVPLNEVGLAQARALASWWERSDRPLNAIYSSDLSRAYQTAEPLSDATGLPIRTDSRLREFNLGTFQGLTMDEIRARYPVEHDAMLADYMGYVIPRGESRYELQVRMYAVWSEIVEREAGDVAIVTHGNSVKVMLFKLFGVTPELRALHVENTSVTTLEWGERGWAMAELTALHHLATASVGRDEQ